MVGSFYLLPILRSLAILNSTITINYALPGLYRIECRLVVLGVLDQPRVSSTSREAKQRSDWASGY
jgi:hypothetical protein